DAQLILAFAHFLAHQQVAGGAQLDADGLAGQVLQSLDGLGGSLAAGGRSGAAGSAGGGGGRAGAGAGGQDQSGGQTGSGQEAAAGDLIHIHTLLLNLRTLANRQGAGDPPRPQTDDAAFSRASSRRQPVV